MYPSLIYCITAWGNAANTHLNPLIILQICIISRIFEVDHTFHTAPLLRNLNALPVRDTHRYMCRIMVYKSVNGKGPRLYSRVTLVVPFARTNIFKNSFRIHATLTWNTLPSLLIECDDYNKLKSETKKYWMSNFIN